MNKQIQALAFGFLLSFTPWLVGTAQAEQLPRRAGADDRVQVFDYDPNDVYIINAQVGYSGLIQLEEGEIIHDDGGLGMGDAKAWSLAVKGNNIFFKPVSILPDTNMLVVTNRRTYAFQLTTNGDNPTYIARFKHKDTQAEAEQKAVNMQPKMVRVVGEDGEGNEILIDHRINTHYVYRGDAWIKPTHAWDDSRFTYLQYDHGAEMPVAYRLLKDNSEQLVNTHVEDDTLVIHEIGTIYRLRLGKAVGDVGNQVKKLPEFNRAATSQDGAIRSER